MASTIAPLLGAPHRCGYPMPYPLIYLSCARPERGRQTDQSAAMSIRNDSAPTENQLVARNIHRFRRERAMSLGELARRSGLSKQTLSKIEQGLGNPTVDTLAQLGGALDLPARRFLTEWGTPVYVQRHDEGSWNAHAEWAERILDETYGSGYVRTLVLTLERVGRQPQVIDPHPSGTLHHLYVITGKVRAGPVSEPIDLVAGDFARFPGDTPHLLACLSERASAHMVTTVPQVRQFGPTVTSSGDAGSVSDRDGAQATP
jgi:transcriptional regulator with XRE-family HTH domain